MQFFLNMFILALTVNGSHLARQCGQFFKVQVLEGLAGNPRILAKGVDLGPVGGVNTILLQLMKRTGAELLLLGLPAFFATRVNEPLKGFAHLHILTLGHLVEMLGTAPCPLAHELALVPIGIATVVHLVEHGIKPSVDPTHNCSRFALARQSR